MSLVSSVGSAGLSSGESYRAAGDGTVTGSRSVWGQNTANMTVQYRPDLGSISLDPLFSDSGGVTTPFSSDLGTVVQTRSFTPFCLQRTNDFSAPVEVVQSNQTHVSTKQSILEAQRERIFRAVKMKNCASPISPLSLQDSAAAGILDHSILPPRNLESYRFKFNDSCVQSRASSFYGDPSFRGPYGPFCRDVQFSDLPIVRGPSAFRFSTCSSSNSRVQSNSDNALSFKLKDNSLKQFHGESTGNEQSKRLKRTLEELEKELLSDDTDFTNSTCYTGQAERPTVEVAERDWADVLEDLLSESPDVLLQRDGHITAAEPVLSCNSRVSNSQINTETSLASDISSQTYTPQRSTLSQQLTMAGQHLPMIGDVSGHPKQLLLACASAIAENKTELATSTVAALKQVVSTYGDPMQRLAAYMMEGLVARIESRYCMHNQGQALKSKNPLATEVLSAMHVLYQVCPYFQFGHMAASGAIAEAFKDEDRVHIIDFEIGQGNQWLALIRDLASRPGGPPKLRITGVGDPESNTSRPGGLQWVSRQLGEVAQVGGVPFEFHPLAMKVSEVQPWMLESKPGEALAVNFAFQLHHMADESVCTTNPRDCLLRMVRAMNPKLVTLVEYEANTNTSPFYPRFVEALSYYTALFESLDAALPRESRDRVNIEQNFLAKDIVNIIACEGSQRVERYELAGKWQARMIMAGFQSSPLSSNIHGTIKCLLQKFSDSYRLKEEGGALHLGWLDRVLIVSSAWK